MWCARYKAVAVGLRTRKPVDEVVFEERSDLMAREHAAELFASLWGPEYEVFLYKRVGGQWVTLADLML